MVLSKQSKQRLVRVQEKGQVTLPAEMRRSLGLKKGDLVAVTSTDGGVLIKLVEIKEQQGSPWLKELYDYFAPVREEIRARGLSEEEVNADIDAAVREVRARQRD
ncbi:MAG: AbrB/MazE/SpoVT family DNA-binding domain-containing protein [Chloroflexota bacterium]|nr:AbrB/MazE/SpoVT family DNA-binding domain-containing protein [Chloroflexota bacterium]